MAESGAARYWRVLVIVGTASAVLSVTDTSRASESLQACCFPAGNCQLLTPTGCENQLGVPQPIGTTCATVTCPVLCMAAGPECDGECPAGTTCVNPGLGQRAQGAVTNALALCLCVPEIPQGGSCEAQPDACASGLVCEEGVCCDMLCPAPGRCDLPGSLGVCTAPAAPAPLLSSAGLTAVIAILIGLGGVAFVRRRQQA